MRGSGNINIEDNNFLNNRSKINVFHLVESKTYLLKMGIRPLVLLEVALGAETDSARFTTERSLKIVYVDMEPQLAWLGEHLIAHDAHAAAILKHTVTNTHWLYVNRPPCEVIYCISIDYSVLSQSEVFFLKTS